MTSDWNLDAIPFESIEPAQIRQEEELFYLVTAASFIESGAALYTANLATYFDGDEDMVAWLKSLWEVEELRHGRVLCAYVRHVWPEFAWDAAYAHFLADYSRLCTMAELERSRSLELVARCVVEMGTATYYRALAAQSAEPVLAGIAGRISAQEVGHYRHFYGQFRKYRALEATPRRDVLAALGRRLAAVGDEDAHLALWHAFVAREGAHAADAKAYRALARRIGVTLRQQYPADLAAKMLLKPLDLPAWLGHALVPPLAGALYLALPAAGR
ncbi:MAG TPA: hypothetical protein VMC81_03510 [Rhodocyclaceae bacterium]|nr:hypothetical protein [Rhodocyclaceae bacterium]